MNNEKYKINIILIIIILLQTIFKIYIDIGKNDYYIDELYSYGLMNYKKAYIIDNEDFSNNWHNKEYFDDYVSISSEEFWNWKSVYTNQMEDYHPPLYYILLRIAASCTVGRLSKWSGLILNIIIFIICDIVLYLIGKLLLKNKPFALFMVFIYGFSKFSVENTLFIRMYQLLELQLLLTTYWHIKNYNDKKLTIKEMISLITLIIFGTLTHYYYIMFLLPILIINLIKYIRRKQIKNILKYIAVVIIAEIAICLIFPGYIGQLKKNFVRCNDNQEIPIASNMNSKSYRQKQYLAIIDENMFNIKLKYILIAIAIIGILSIIVAIIKSKKLKYDKELNYIVIPAAFYWYVISTTSPYIDIRYILPLFIFILIFIVYIVKIETNVITKNKKESICIVVVISVLYTCNLFVKVDYKYQYKESKEIFETIEKYKDLPCIYFYYKRPILENTFVKNLNYLRRFENVYIQDVKTFASSKISDILLDIDTSKGVLIYLSKGEAQSRIYRIMNTNSQFKNYEKIVDITPERYVYDQIYRLY